MVCEARQSAFAQRGEPWTNPSHSETRAKQLDIKMTCETRYSEKTLVASQ